MIRICLFLTVLSLPVCAVGQYPEQSRGGPDMDFPFGELRLMLNRPDVKEELKITKEQEEALKQLFQSEDDERRAIRTELRGTTEIWNAETNKKLQELVRGVWQRKLIELDTILKPDQFRRLMQLRTQFTLGGVFLSSFSDPQLGKVLKLTPEQQRAMSAQAIDLEKELRELAQKKREEAKSKLLGMLTAEQRKLYEELIGAPFDFNRPSEPPK